MKLLILAFTVFSLNVSASISHVEQRSFKELFQAAKNTANPMNERWQAVIKAGEVASAEELITLQELASSTDWFIRNATLVALENGNLDLALAQAKHLVKDKALVVRSAAVATLAKKNTLEIRQLLVNELSEKYNFSGKQSLWVRPQIMKHLAKTVGADERPLMVRFLFDSDNQVAESSMQALEKITNIRFEGKNQLAQWQSYVKKNGWL